jgi:hypothetical protein
MSTPPAGQLAAGSPEASVSARARLRLPRAPARLGQSAGWAAPARPYRAHLRHSVSIGYTAAFVLLTTDYLLPAAVLTTGYRLLTTGCCTDYWLPTTYYRLLY